MQTTHSSIPIKIHPYTGFHPYIHTRKYTQRNTRVHIYSFSETHLQIPTKIHENPQKYIQILKKILFSICFKKLDVNFSPQNTSSCSSSLILIWEYCIFTVFLWVLLLLLTFYSIGDPRLKSLSSRKVTLDVRQYKKLLIL